MTFLVRQVLEERSKEELVRLVLAYRQRWLETLGTYEPEIDGERLSDNMGDYIPKLSEVRRGR